MTFYNRVILTGRVVTPPQYRHQPDGSPVIQFPLELDETKDLTGRDFLKGNKRPAPNRTGSGGLIHIVAIGELADVKLDLQSGQHLLVVGRLNQRSWKTHEGRNRTRTEVIAMDLRALQEAR
jgi:single-stranded DNA-binding protein